ncbi:MAG: hypothetical protein GY798_00770 [Hyphomicrobiales bacterium]|nr:hypothetical protein [Hyphomicrobiales bacterium]
MQLTIGGHSVPVSEAADKLVREYPTATVRYYDLGDGRGGPSPTDQVTADDLGRMMVFAARLKANRAAELLDTSIDVTWSDDGVLGDLEADPDLPDKEWLTTECVEAAHQLFLSVNGVGTSYAQSSKLLHLKWPGFFPIADRRVRKLYGSHATSLHNDHLDVLHRARHLKRWGRVDIRIYWLLFRRDLIANQLSEALDDLRVAVAKAPVLLNRAEHRDNLAKVNDLRLLDMVAWSL